MRCSLLSLVLIAASASCTHSEAFVSSSPEPLGALEPGYRLTFEASVASEPSWTSDGDHVVYVYAAEPWMNVHAGSQCIGVVPLGSGSRTYSFCDTRAVLADSIATVSAAALRPNGQLLFFQSIAKPFKTTGSIRSMNLWLADTATALLQRTNLAVFPHIIGDSSIDHLSGLQWLDVNTFVAEGRDTLNTLVYLIRGEMVGNQLTMTQINGPDSVAHWSATKNGDIYFVRGSLRAIDDSFGGGAEYYEERTMWRTPAGGGANVLVSVLPDSSIRGISCTETKCLVLASRRLDMRGRFSLTNGTLRIVQLADGALRQISYGPTVNFNSWELAILRPDGNNFVFRTQGTLFREVLPIP